MTTTLSPYRLSKARDLYNLFNVFNSLSWQFLTGNIITLFALRLGANSTYIGILSAVLYLTFFFLPLGKMLTSRFSMVKIFGTAWIVRAIGMTPVLFVPFVFASGRQSLALLLILLGTAIFHVTRGIGMIGNNPILSFLASGPDRGSYTTQIQIINSAVGMLGGFIIALLLGRDPPLFLYVIIVGVGICIGIFSGLLMNRIPGPGKEEGVKNKNLIKIVQETMTQPSLRRFIITLLMIALVSGVSRTFIIVYSREVFGQSDGMVSLYAVFGGLGTLIVGLLIKFLVDRVGAKPLFSVCVILGLISMIPVLIFPASTTTPTQGVSDNFTTVTLYLTFLFFIINFGWLGAEGIMQTYFMGLIPANQMMDLGIVYFLGFGVAGAGGSLLSGLFLDAVTALSGSHLLSFKILYAILIAISAAALLLMRKLVPLGALPFKGALEVMFSYRDLKAISLLEKLNKTSDSEEEEEILGALHDSPSSLSTKGLLVRARSPRLSVRMESIRAIDALPALNEDAEKALIDDIIKNPYTTAYSSARTLGNHNVFAAIPLLRELAVSDDYMLAGEAMIALAKLADNAFRPEIEHTVQETDNPRLKLAGVEAIGIYKYPLSLPLLLDTLRGDNPPPYLRDEVVLSMANILGVQHKFYPLLVRFLADESMVSALAMDEVESAFEYYMSVHGRKRVKKKSERAVLDQHAKVFQSAASNYIQNTNRTELCRWILLLPEDLVDTVIQTVLSEVVLDDDYLSYPRLRLLITQWAAHELRLWTNKLKGER
jgi:Na+/melibiose symporter-like transporter